MSSTDRIERSQTHMRTHAPFSEILFFLSLFSYFYFILIKMLRTQFWMLILFSKSWRERETTHVSVVRVRVHVRAHSLRKTQIMLIFQLIKWNPTDSFAFILVNFAVSVPIIGRRKALMNFQLMKWPKSKMCCRRDACLPCSVPEWKTLH